MGQERGRKWDIWPHFRDPSCSTGVSPHLGRGTASGSGQQSRLNEGDSEGREASPSQGWGSCPGYDSVHMEGVRPLCPPDLFLPTLWVPQSWSSGKGCVQCPTKAEGSSRLGDKQRPSKPGGWWRNEEPGPDVKPKNSGHQRGAEGPLTAAVQMAHCHCYPIHRTFIE